MSKIFYEEGPYVGEVTGQALGESSAKGTPYFMLKVRVLGTPEPNDKFLPLKVQYERSIYFYLTEKTAPFVVENLAMIGFTGKISQLDPDAPNGHSFKGQQVDLYCSHEEYDGEWRERWNLSRVLEVTKIEPKKLRQIEALFGKAMKSATPATVKKVFKPEEEDQRNKDYTNPEITDQDVPANFLGDDEDGDPIPF